MTLDERLWARIHAEAGAVPALPAAAPLSVRRRRRRPAVVAAVAAGVVVGAVAFGALALNTRSDPSTDVRPAAQGQSVVTTAAAMFQTTGASSATDAADEHVEATMAPTTVAAGIPETTVAEAVRETGEVLDADTPLLIAEVRVGGAPDPAVWWVTIENRSEGPVDLSGWSLEDTVPPTHRFDLPRRTLGPGSSLLVWYGYSGNDVCDTPDGDRIVYWCSRDPDGDGHSFVTWNDGGDTARLIDRAGNVVSAYSY